MLLSTSIYSTYESSASAESLTILFPFVVYNYLAIYHPYFPGALLTAKAEYNMLIILLLNKLGIQVIALNQSPTRDGNLPRRTIVHRPSLANQMRSLTLSHQKGQEKVLSPL